MSLLERMYIITLGGGGVPFTRTLSSSPVYIQEYILVLPESCDLFPEQTLDEKAKVRV